MDLARRFWWLVRIGRLVAPRLHDFITGVVLEDEGRPIGVGIIRRIGVSDVWAITPWMVAGVAVLSIGTSWVTLWRYLRV